MFAEDSSDLVVGYDVGPSQLGVIQADGFARGNVIAAASDDGAGAGILLQSDGNAMSATVAGNFIGIDRAGAGTGLGNDVGIAVSSSDGNQLGPGNTIAHNQGRRRDP